jgi:hypothetical protein
MQTFVKKREEWRSWLDSDPKEPNSIQAQLFELLLSDINYRVMRTARDNDISAAIANPTFWYFFEQGYLARQVLSIRKLLDKGKNVISFPRLLDEMRRYRCVMTRFNYVSYDGTPYEPESWRICDEAEEFKVSYGIFGEDAPALLKYLRAKTRHEKFDRLSGIESASRKQGDLIDNSVFDRLQTWLDDSGASKFIELANKFMAHASDPNSRGNLRLPIVTLDDVERVHHAFIRVQRAVINDVLFFGVWSEVVPYPPLTQFVGLDKEFVSSGIMRQMDSKWYELKDIREAWKTEFLDELTASKMVNDSSASS